MIIPQYKLIVHIFYKSNTSLLINNKLLKSPSEIVFDFIENEQKNKEINIFSNSVIAKYWERACNDHSYSFNIINSPIIYMTNELKNISKNIPYIIGMHENNNDKSNKDMREIVDSLYNFQFTENKPEQIVHLRKISILLCFLLNCCGFDITYDIISQYWKNKNITDYYKRYVYIIEKKPEIIQSGPLWFIANMVYSQVISKIRSGRGAIHDGFHIINIPYIDIFFTNDSHFTKIRDIVNKEIYDSFYRKIIHMNEVKLTEKTWTIRKKYKWSRLITQIFLHLKSLFKHSR